MSCLLLMIFNRLSLGTYSIIKARVLWLLGPRLTSAKVEIKKILLRSLLLRFLKDSDKRMIKKKFMILINSKMIVIMMCLIRLLYDCMKLKKRSNQYMKNPSLHILITLRLILRFMMFSKSLIQ
jgi:hypothetical protein